MASETSFAGVRVTGLAGRYATALFELALEEGALDAVAADLQSLKTLLSESDDFTAMVRSPILSRSQQEAVMDAILAKGSANKITSNFAGLLAKKRRLFALGDIIKAFATLHAAHKGEVEADVVSAAPLSEQQLGALKDQLRSAMGREIQVNVSVDEALIGGLILKVGSRMIDASLATRLSNLERTMKEVG
ncbi:MAG: F0F1 ATP synthase subunit delta [Alphaproteobacteria bacterium]